MINIKTPFELPTLIESAIQSSLSMRREGEEGESAKKNHEN